MPPDRRPVDTSPIGSMRVCIGQGCAVAVSQHGGGTMTVYVAIEASNVNRFLDFTPFKGLFSGF